MMFKSIVKKPEFWLLLTGLIVRLLFVLIFAKPYYGRENVHVDGDTYSFAWSFQSVYETGTYTVNPELEYGYFGRMPGYPFFMGVFYLLTGNNWERAFILISWIQVIIDLLSAWLLFLIVLKISKNRTIGLISLFLYATYPFVIVWIPVVYAEVLGVNLIVVSFYFFINRGERYNLIISGLILGFGILVRPQLILMIPAMLLVLFIENYKNIFSLVLKSLKFLLPVILIYGGWPLRNYLNYNKLIFTQDSRGFYNWDIDVMAFWAYVYSVKSEWDPQYTQIIKNEKVTWPKVAYRTYEDSIKLERAVWLSQNCGSGFSHKSGYWKEIFNTPNCNKEIEELFLTLRENQIKFNPWNFYVKVPLANLRKAFFKTTLSDSSSLVRKFASLLFYYRSFLILLGLGFYMLVIKNRSYWNKELLVPLVYFTTLYLLLCGGTSVPLRNIEMRYFLPADILLIIPASYLVFSILNRIGFKIVF